jgi:hypothetical protein
MNCCLIQTLLWMGILAQFNSVLPTQEAAKDSAITLHVMDQAGGNVPGAQMQLVPLPTGLSGGLTTDHDGNLLLELPPGGYDVTVNASAFFPATKHIEAEPGSGQVIQIVLKVRACPPGPCLMVTGKEETKAAVPLTVVVVDPNWGVLSNAQIKLAPRPATMRKNPKTNELGEISLDVPPGTYDLFVTEPDFVPWAENIRVGANANKTVTVVLQLAATTRIVQLDGPCVPIQNDDDSRKLQRVCSTSVTITVTDAAGAAIPYAQIGGFPEAITSDFYEIDESGRFGLKLDPGRYQMSVTSPGFRRWTKRIELKEKEDQTLTVVLQTGDCTPGPCAAVGSNH